MSFPFPELLEFLEEEKDQIEFMRIAQEVGLGRGDIEFAKLLIAFQLYRGLYAEIPRDIKRVHAGTISELTRLREEIRTLAERSAADARQVQARGLELKQALLAVEPQAVVEALHKRLLAQTTKALTGSVQMVSVAQTQLDAAARRLTQAAAVVEMATNGCTAIQMRRVWACAFITCFLVCGAFMALAWCILGGH